ncbi:hypothetical protein QCA50_016967 [Cerrena zonata]|uniref:CxC2-like cysteine cluster KDZ transposase-associated domain-containing protein n=1 Tax=Cerrena zonata TaxID=2478898 RepID=A0AAW0FGW5_9APHY
MKWRCHDCFGEPVFCTHCLRTSHQRHPFHRISHWDGYCFSRSSLGNAGLTLNLGHGGSLCPEYGDSLPEDEIDPLTTRLSGDILHSPTIASGSHVHPVPHQHPPEPVEARAEYSGLSALGLDLNLGASPLDLDSTKVRFWENDRGNLYETSPLRLPPSFSSSSSPPPSSPIQTSRPIPPLHPVPSPDVPPSSPEPIIHQARLSRYHIRSQIMQVDTAADPFYAGQSEDEDDDERNMDTVGNTLKPKRTNQSYDKFQCPMMTIIDIAGVHELRTQFCRCHPLNVNPLHNQLQAMGLFPASRQKTRTAFTFRVLEHFDISNLEGKVSATTYYNSIARFTSNLFPKNVPNRYRELMRALRQWRDLTLRRRAGHPYIDQEAAISPGGLALFCATCPQPEVNLPDDWKEDDKTWKYVPTLLADGNFKQDHIAMKNDFDDVALNDGLAYMVARKRFDEYLSEAPRSIPPTSTCHEHRAVSQQNHAHAHLDVTGIGAIACGRHGCFYPNSVVNFRKGEGQRYMDYAFVNAINYISGIAMVMMIYDIMCQYFLNFRKRVEEVSQYLTLPENIKFKKAIGLFHVHGHVKECYARYAPTFIKGAGMLVGEIIETLWNPLNHTASSARAMTWYH